MINYYGDFIRTVDDYPVEGIKFYDLNSIFASTVWSKKKKKKKELVNDTTDQIEDIIYVVGIESRGFVVGAAMAQHMGLPCNG